ncbi:MAG: 16S rRNA (guanine(527)-N(7))-methyltransferase RsmG [Burkholderiales bacterium]
MTPGERLARGIAALGVPVSGAAQQTLLDYLALIEKWNRVHNLTAIRDPAQMLTHHLLDSLAVLPHLTGPRVLDVGAGAGLPGIVLAIVRPDWAVTLLDSNHKKAAFLQQAVIELKLANADVVCERIENLDRPQAYDVLVSRAFSALAEFVTAALPVLAPGGVLAAMKGVYPHEEIAQLPPSVRPLREVVLTVPGLDAARHLLLFERA